jgi:hypothetical protein
MLRTVPEAAGETPAWMIPMVLSEYVQYQFTFGSKTINRNTHLIREQVQDSRFRHLYNLKSAGFHAENKFLRETLGLLMLDTWLNRYGRA